MTDHEHGGDGKRRCAWASNGLAEEIAYHDREWGVPVSDDRTFFEFITLEGAQAGLSWRTILLKRDNYRVAFAAFDPARVARFTPQRVARLLADPGIVRNRLKVHATVSNAQAFMALQAAHGSFSAYIWAFVDGRPVVNRWKTSAEVPASSPLSDRLSKALKQQGFKFVGTTICYSLLQATGLVNDHLTSCFRHAPCAAMRPS